MECEHKNTQWVKILYAEPTAEDDGYEFIKECVDCGVTVWDYSKAEWSIIPIRNPQPFQYLKSS